MSDFMLVLLECAKPGSRVKKGDVVAGFDRQYQVLRLDDYKASVAGMDSDIQKLRADQEVASKAHEQLVRSAKADFDKAQLDMKTIEVRSANEAEAFKLSEEEAAAHYKQIVAETKLVDESQRSELKAAEIDRDQAKIELQRASNNVQKMIMKAPIDGIVVMQTIYRNGDFGQVQAGDQVYPGMMFMSIVDPSSMVINATINQVDSEQMRIGMKAVAHFDAYPDLALPATVVAVGAMTKSGGWRANYVREVPIRLRLDQMDPRVIPDLSASADVVLGQEKQAAMAPLESIFRDTPEARPYVLVRRPSGFERREVELGLANNIVAAVRSGLRKGDVVACQRPPQEKQP